jgi:predicted dehydrogenase
MKRVAIIGCGLRMTAFVSALEKDFSDTHQIVALFDIDAGKMAAFAKRCALKVSQYTNFAELCAECQPDLALIGTVDVYHAEYVVACLDAGIEVICEKPLCINREQCAEIIAAQERNPQVFAATSHNSRYRPVAQTLKKAIDDGIIGEVLSLEYRETLDLVHGKSYFRRWNSRRALSNGLQLHKSTHHFDKMNFLLGTKAKEVTANGALIAYGANAKHEYSGENCHSCEHKEVCPDYFEYDKELFDSDLYTPDLCIWSEDIDIEDSFAASIVFENGVFASYSLCAHASYEGEVIHVQGTKGRLVATQLVYRSDPKDVHNQKAVSEESLKVYRFGSAVPEDIEIQRLSGSHGGADKMLFAELFALPPAPGLPTLQDGINAVLTGTAIVESMQQGCKIQV